MGFRPAAATRCPDKREIWHGGADRPLPRVKFHVYRGRNVGIQPPKLSKFRILAINFTLRNDSFAGCRAKIGKNVMFFVFIGRPARSAAMPVLFLLMVQKCFLPRRGDTLLRYVRNFTFIGAKMWEYSPQNCKNLEFWLETFTSGATRLQYFYEILSVCMRL